MKGGIRDFRSTWINVLTVLSEMELLWDSL